MSQNIKEQLVKGTAWSVTGQVGYLLISLTANIILARIVGPLVFGQVGIIMFFIMVAGVLTESGLSGALVRKKEVTEEDYSTVFIFNLGVSLALFTLFILIAGFVSQLYEDSRLRILLIVTSAVLIVNAFKIINNVKLVRALNYRKKSTIELISVSIAALISTGLAFFFNAGVWAVVSLHLLTAALTTSQLWLYFGPLKNVTFSKGSFKGLYKFGVNTTLASLLNTAFINVYQLILGKYFSVTQTGLFYQANKLQGVPVGLVNSLTQGIVFAALSKVQGDQELFSWMYTRIMKLFTVIVGFVCLMTIFYSEEIVFILYGEDWSGVVYYIHILIIASFFYMQEMFNRILFKIFDRTQNILYLEIVKGIFQTVTIVIGILTQRIDILLFGLLLTSFIGYFNSYYYSRKIYGGFSLSEILVVLKVIVSTVVVFMVGQFLITVLSLSGLRSFFIFPLLLVIYGSLIKITRVSNILKDALFLSDLIFRKNK